MLLDGNQVISGIGPSVLDPWLVVTVLFSRKSQIFFFCLVLFCYFSKRESMRSVQPLTSWRGVFIGQIWPFSLQYNIQLWLSGLSLTLFWWWPIDICILWPRISTIYIFISNYRCSIFIVFSFFYSCVLFCFV